MKHRPATTTSPHRAACLCADGSPSSVLTTTIPDRALRRLARGLLCAVTMQVLFGAVDGMRDALTYHRERHTVLAGNVANLDTPGFSPADLVRTDLPEPGSTTTPGAASTLTVTHAGHLTGADGVLAGTTEIVHDELPRSADDNGVSLEREMAKVEANRLRYQATSELVSKRLALLRYTAGDGT